MTEHQNTLQGDMTMMNVLITAVSLGYPDEHPDKRGRKGLDQVVTWM